MSDLPIQITAEIMPGKADPSATARFVNHDRAAQYARMLADTGDYTAGGVWLTDIDGTRYRLDEVNTHAPEFPTGSHVRIGNGRTVYVVERRGTDWDDGRICITSEQTGESRWIHPDRLTKL